MKYLHENKSLSFIRGGLLFLSLSTYVVADDNGKSPNEPEDGAALPVFEKDVGEVQREDVAGEHEATVETEIGPIFVPTFESIQEIKAKALLRQRQAEDDPQKEGGSEESEAR